MQEVFEGLSVTIAQTDAAGWCPARLGQPATRSAGGRSRRPVQAKHGWTGVSRFAASLVFRRSTTVRAIRTWRTVDEHVGGGITAVTETLRAYLTA